VLSPLAGAERKAGAGTLSRFTPNPAFDEEDADLADCDVANWQ